jgi:hypothetical protein
MPGPIVNIATQVMCPHAGPGTIAPSQTRVLVMGTPAATVASAVVVAGCPFTLPPPSPGPCLSIQWAVPATRVLAMGQPVIIAQPGAGVSVGPMPGPANIVPAQTRVIAT